MAVMASHVDRRCCIEAKVTNGLMPETISQMKSIQNTLQEIVREGFEPVTQWIWRDGKIRLASLNWRESSGWLYAFVVDDSVKYVGLTSRVLRSRMDDYRDNTEEQTTRLRELIRAELLSDRRIEVYGRHSPETDRRESDEARLRADLNPPWNRC